MLHWVLRPLRAFAPMRGRFDVDIVGDAPYSPALKNLAKELDVDARFWEHIDNDLRKPKVLYGLAAILVFTSEAENFPIVLLEGMISGATVITSDGHGLPRRLGVAQPWNRWNCPKCLRSTSVTAGTVTWTDKS